MTRNGADHDTTSPAACVILEELEPQDLHLLDLCLSGEALGDAVSLFGDDVDDENPAQRRRSPRRNLTRERRRAEMTALREEKQALEKEISIRLKVREKQTEALRRSAEHELDLRKRAEAENALLRRLTKSQVDLHRAVGTLVGKRAAEEFAAQRSKRVQAEATLSMLSAHMRREVYQLYETAIEHVFRGDGWAIDEKEVGTSFVCEKKSVGPHESCVWSVDDSEIDEVRHTRHVSYPYEQVADAAWRTSMAPFAESDRLFELLQWDDDVVVFKHRAEATPRSTVGHLLTAVLVMKKFVEDNRTVVVWRSKTTTTSCFDEHATGSPFSDEEGWNIVERVPGGLTEYEPDTAVVRQIVRMRNVWSPQSAEDARALDFEDLIVRSTKEDVSAIIDAMENLLIA